MSEEIKVSALYLEAVIAQFLVSLIFIAHHYSIGFHTGSGFLKDLHGTVTITLTGSKMAKTITLDK